MWIATSVNPFRENIEDMILGVAKEQGINANSAEEAWELMGGTTFTE